METADRKKTSNKQPEPRVAGPGNAENKASMSQHGVVMMIFAVL
jgi:hypothetical protein